MIVISLNGVSKGYGGRTIFAGLDFTLDERGRIGLVGPNGAGKTTLLRLLAGADDPDAGEATRRRGLRVALLPQHVAATDETPLDLLRAARQEPAQIEARLAACEA